MDTSQLDSGRLNRTFNLVVLLVAMALAGVVVALIADCSIRGGESFTPLGGYSNPQIITSSKTVSVGGYILVEGTKCNLSGEPVSVVGTAYFRRESGPVEYVGYLTGTRLFEPGCMSDKEFRNDLPPEVTPGTWVLTGWDEVRSNHKVQRVTWETEPFEVLP